MMRRVRRLILMGSIWMICAVSVRVGYGEVSRGVVTLDSEQSLTVRFSNQFGIRMSPLSVNKTLHFSEVFYTNSDGVKWGSHPISTDWIGPMMMRTADGSDAAPRFRVAFMGLMAMRAGIQLRRMCLR